MPDGTALHLHREEKIFRRLVMADPKNKWSDNVKGKFYCDTECIDCDLCRQIAPDFFTRNGDRGHSFVMAQPSTPEEIELCLEAMDECPVEAIGNDGETVNKDEESEANNA